MQNPPLKRWRGWSAGDCAGRGGCGLGGQAARQVPVAFTIVPGDAAEASGREACGALFGAVATVITDRGSEEGGAECKFAGSVPPAVT